MPDQIVLSQPAVQRNGAAPQGLAGSGRRRTLALKNTEVTATIMTSQGQVIIRDGRPCNPAGNYLKRFALYPATRDICKSLNPPLQSGRKNIAVTAPLF